MADKEIRSIPPVRRRQTTISSSPSAGWSLVELMVVTAVVSVLAVGSLPMITNTMHNMHLSAASSALSGAVQAARYQAISTGCPVTMAVSTGTYQLQAEKVVINSGVPACDTTFTPVQYCANNCVVPYASSEVSLVTPYTIQFNPSGTVALSSSPLTPQSISLQLALSSSTATKTITVSGVGNVKVSVP
jgi:prepilin-type N-terminal cleavage/methylation domain-containing protein